MSNKGSLALLSRSGRQAAKNGRNGTAYPHLETDGPLGVDVICSQANNTGLMNKDFALRASP